MTPGFAMPHGHDDKRSTIGYVTLEGASNDQKENRRFIIIRNHIVFYKTLDMKGCELKVL